MASLVSQVFVGDSKGSATLAKKNELNHLIPPVEDAPIITLLTGAIPSLENVQRPINQKGKIPHSVLVIQLCIPHAFLLEIVSFGGRGKTGNEK